MTTSLATNLSYNQITLNIRSVLVNLWNSLSYIRTVSMHTIDYVNAVMTGTLSPHDLPIIDLKKMLAHIEETLPPTLHLPVSSEDTLHFYRYLHTHVLITNKQFLLLIDVPIQDRSQQLSIYKTFTLDTPHGNFTAWYDINAQYLGFTQDETMAVEMSSHQFSTCQAANGQFCNVTTPFNHLQIHHPASQLYISRMHEAFWQDVHYKLGKIEMSTYTQCMDINHITFSHHHSHYTHLQRRDIKMYYHPEANSHLMTTTSLQHYNSLLPSNPTLWKLRFGSQQFFGYGKSKHDQHIIYKFSDMATFGKASE